MKDKYVKLEALEKLAAPMDAIHEKEGYDEEGEKDGADDEHAKCACPCCGAPCEACNEADEEGYEDEEGDDEDS